MTEDIKQQRRRNYVKKSLTKLRAHRKKHNLCRDCGIVKEPERTERILCSRCAGIQVRCWSKSYVPKQPNPAKTPKQPKILPLVMPAGIESRGRTDRMMELSALLSKRVPERLSA